MTTMRAESPGTHMIVLPGGGMPHTLRTKPSQWLGGSGGITGMIPRKGVL
jgi:hypothetical protein